MPTNNKGQSDIVTHKTNTWSIYYAKRIFHYIMTIQELGLLTWIRKEFLSRINQLLLKIIL